jgi:hypothetical protein
MRRVFSSIILHWNTDNTGCAEDRGLDSGEREKRRREKDDLFRPAEHWVTRFPNRVLRVVLIANGTIQSGLHRERNPDYILPEI